MTDRGELYFVVDVTLEEFAAAFSSLKKARAYARLVEGVKVFHAGKLDEWEVPSRKHPFDVTISLVGEVLLVRALELSPWLVTAPPPLLKVEHNQALPQIDITCWGKDWKEAKAIARREWRKWDNACRGKIA